MPDLLHCTVYPILSLLEQGYEVQVVADAGGSPTKEGDELSLRRMEKAGATVVGTNQLLAELAQDWTQGDGAKILPIVVEGLQGLGQPERPSENSRSGIYARRIAAV